jgi:hypothetical protein
MSLRILVLVFLITSSACAQHEANRVPDYQPISPQQRFTWFMDATAGPTSLLVAGPFSAGLGTAFNRPKEYGPHWEGFGKRYGMRLTGVSTGNAMEAGLGAIWGEDPRYFRSPNRAFGKRVEYVVKATFVAPDRDGRMRPAYAGLAGNVGNNFLSNTWRAPSENGPGNAALRCVWGITGEMASDAFAEFWPDVKKLIFRRK